MPITINGQPHADGAPLTIGGVQAQEVTVNGVSVWKNTIPPSAITNLAASSNRVGQILVTFTHSVGLPTPQHDLYISGLLVANNISSGYVHSIASGDYFNIFIRAHNTAGSIDSNVVSARSQVVAGSEVFTGTRNWTPPAGVKSVTVCCCGGGGAGHAGRGGGGGGGGAVSWSGAYSSGTINVAIGAGGVATPIVTNLGTDGGNTTVVSAGISVTGLGGAAAVFCSGGAGRSGGGRGGVCDPWENGFPSSGCGGSYAGGLKTHNNHGGGGGAGGYGAGGTNNIITPANGGGGGAGGQINGDFPPMHGAAGRAVISWAQH